MIFPNCIHFPYARVGDTSGHHFSISDYSQKIIFLDFWGSWFKPCLKQIPALSKIYNEFKDKGVVFVGVAADISRDDWTKAIHGASIPWVNVSDLKGNRNTCLMYGVSYFPTNFLIDKNGKIIARDFNPDQLREKLALLAR